MIPRSPLFWLVIGLWVPAMIAASYVWRFGEYYDYGWFVPPAAILLTCRRWSEVKGIEGRAMDFRPRWLWVVVALLLFCWLLVLRTLGYADPAWRLPIALLGLTAAVGGHVLIALKWGWKVSGGFIWITFLWMSALPWPSVVERQIVHQLTQGVVVAVADAFQILGKPVEILGDRLRLHETTVEVTDGCSGVRSFQSFVMATWFFAELQRLRLVQTLSLLIFACALGFLVNMLRTFSLAQIRFQHGPEAFDRAHDTLGLLAFVVSAVLFYIISSKMSGTPRRKLVRTVQG